MRPHGARLNEQRRLESGGHVSSASDAEKKGDLQMPAKKKKKTAKKKAKKKVTKKAKKKPAKKKKKAAKKKKKL